MEKQNSKGTNALQEKVSASFHGKGFRSGVYATVVSVLVIAAVIVGNLIISSLNIRKDMTTDGRYSLTEETKELLEGVEDKITFYYLTKDGASVSWFDTFFKLYEKECKNIKFETVDLVLYPKFAEQYTDESVMQYSLIAVNEANQKSKYISYEDMLLTQLTIDYSYQMSEEVVGLDVEGQLNAAIMYVTSDEQTNLYAVTGHGEIALGTEGENLLRKANINYDTLETMTAETIPEDCDVLYIAVPETDYTETEAELIEAYIQRGGDLLVTVIYQDGMDNFNRILETYGITVENGVILEGDSSRYVAGYSYALLPNISTEHELMQKFTGTEYIPMQSSHALTVTKEDASLETAVLLSTSAKAYAKRVEGGYVSSMSKEEGDAEGPFNIGVYVKNTEYDSEAAVFSCGLVFYDDYLGINSYANAGLLTSAVNYMAETEMVSAVRTISFDSEEMLVVTNAEANTIAILFVIVLPVVLILAGIIVMLRRKNR